MLGAGVAVRMRRVADGDLEPLRGEVSPSDFGPFQEAFNLMVRQIQRNQEIERALLARDKMATVGQLAAAVAHETRNPLAAISSLTQMLADEVKEDPRLRRYTEVVLKEVSRLDGAIGQLLEYARPLPPRFERVSLVEVVAVLFTYEARRRGVLLRRWPAGEGETALLVDPAQVKQLLVNLVTNALAHTPVGGEIRLGVDPSRETLRVWVENDGPPIPPGERERIFQPFVTARQGGTGLGLAIARRIAENHCGTLEVEGEEDPPRTRFTLELPRLSEPPEVGREAPSDAPGPWPAGAGGGA